jgi:hypothetical protein
MSARCTDAEASVADLKLDGATAAQRNEALVQAKLAAETSARSLEGTVAELEERLAEETAKRIGWNKENDSGQKKAAVLEKQQQQWAEEKKAAALDYSLLKEHFDTALAESSALHRQVNELKLSERSQKRETETMRTELELVKSEHAEMKDSRITLERRVQELQEERRQVAADTSSSRRQREIVDRARQKEVDDLKAELEIKRLELADTIDKAKKAGAQMCAGALAEERRQAEVQLAEERRQRVDQKKEAEAECAALKLQLKVAEAEASAVGKEVGELRVADRARRHEADELKRELELAQGKASNHGRTRAQLQEDRSLLESRVEELELARDEAIEAQEISKAEVAALREDEGARQTEHAKKAQELERALLEAKLAGETAGEAALGEARRELAREREQQAAAAKRQREQQAAAAKQQREHQRELLQQAKNEQQQARREQRQLAEELNKMRAEQRRLEVALRASESEAARIGERAGEERVLAETEKVRAQAELDVRMDEERRAIGREMEQLQAKAQAQAQLQEAQADHAEQAEQALQIAEQQVRKLQENLSAAEGRLQQAEEHGKVLMEEKRQATSNGAKITATAGAEVTGLKRALAQAQQQRDEAETERISLRAEMKSLQHEMRDCDTLIKQVESEHVQRAALSEQAAEQVSGALAESEEARVRFEAEAQKLREEYQTSQAELEAVRVAEAQLRQQVQGGWEELRQRSEEAEMERAQRAVERAEALDIQHELQQQLQKQASQQVQQTQHVQSQQQQQFVRERDALQTQLREEKEEKEAAKARVVRLEQELREGDNIDRAMRETRRRDIERVGELQQQLQQAQSQLSQQGWQAETAAQDVRACQETVTSLKAELAQEGQRMVQVQAQLVEVQHAGLKQAEEWRTLEAELERDRSTAMKELDMERETVAQQVAQAKQNARELERERETKEELLRRARVYGEELMEQRQLQAALVQQQQQGGALTMEVGSLQEQLLSTRREMQQQAGREAEAQANMQRAEAEQSLLRAENCRLEQDCGALADKVDVAQAAMQHLVERVEAAEADREHLHEQTLVLDMERKKVEAAAAAAVEAAAVRGKQADLRAETLVQESSDHASRLRRAETSLAEAERQRGAMEQSQVCVLLCSPSVIARPLTTPPFVGCCGDRAARLRARVAAAAVCSGGCRPAATAGSKHVHQISKGVRPAAEGGLICCTI